MDFFHTGSGGAHAFRKKIPLSVRRCRGGRDRGATEKAHIFVNSLMQVFFPDRLQIPIKIPTNPTKIPRNPIEIPTDPIKVTQGILILGILKTSPY